MLLLSLASSFAITLVCALFLGMNKSERQYAYSFVLRFLKREKKEQE